MGLGSWIKKGVGYVNQGLGYVGSIPGSVIGGVGKGYADATWGGATDTSGLDEGSAAAKKLRDQLAFEKANYGNTVAPQVQGQTIQGQLVQAPNIDDAAGQQIRERQLGALDAVQAAAEGRGPSVGEASYLGKTMDIARQQAGIAAQARGNAGVAARRDRIRALGDQGQRAAVDAALIKANEVAGARGQLTQALGQVREADTGLAVERGRQALQAGTETAQLQQRAATDTAQIGLEAGKANQGAFLQGQQITNQYKLGLGQQSLEANQQTQAAAGKKIDVSLEDKKRYADAAKTGAGVVGEGLSTLGKVMGPAAAASDKRLKADIHDVPKGAAERLAKVMAKVWRYKDEDEGTAHVGPIAQDLEKDPLGRKFVSKDEDGLRYVDVRSLSNLLLSEALRSRKGRKAA